MKGQPHTPSPEPRSSKGKAISIISRWLHVYLSMLGLVALLFFSVTGITVNHPDWLFFDHETIKQYSGTLPLEWIDPTDPTELEDCTEGVNKLDIVEYLRSTHGIRGLVSEFSGDEYQLMIGFNGPAYTAYGTVERENGSYTLNESTLGFMSLMNDLHKGRDTGTVWSAVIDISAVTMIIASLTGLYLLLGLKKRKHMGIITGLVGGIAFLLFYLLFVP
ncbi:MAG: PepSY-associated TM helix domain-containing protein [Opitutales bacterium]|nr:PepSY-associated TM helix domain-containing protein [Opitutales bacterium]